MCWLEDECGLNGKQKTGGVEKLHPPSQCWSDGDER
jgi:hypothetical protein